MNQMKFILIATLILINWSCASTTEPNLKTCTNKVVIDDTLFQSAPNDQFMFDSVWINGDCLHLVVRYSGGCGDAFFNLYTSHSIIKTNPPGRDLRISFEDLDNCEALIQKELSYDLTPLRLVGTNTIFIWINDLEQKLIYKY